MPKTKMPRGGDGNTNITTPKDDRYHSFCFTLFDSHYNLFNLVGPWRYIVAGREICPKSKNQHYQCYIYFAQKLSFNNLKKKLLNHLGKATHIEAAFKDFETNFDYCTKDNDFYEWGEKPRQGARVDLIAIKDNLLNGSTNCEKIRAEDPHLYHMYGRTLEKLEDDYMRKQFRTETTTAEWLYGKTGVGKSHYAFANYHPDTHYLVCDDNGWWDNYKGQDIVIINEFRGEIKFKMLLELCDKYPYCVKRRGRPPLPFVSKHIIITSCAPPEEIYNNALSINDNIDQLHRRITVKEIKGKFIDCA